MNKVDLTKYIDVVIRRKWWVLIPFLLVLLAGLTYALVAPKVYEAKTLILVIPQRVPQDYVRSIVTVSMEDRLRTITQQVMSRTNLEKIIKRYGLFQDESSKHLLLDEKVERLRERIHTRVVRAGRGGGGAFTISFEGKDPVKVAEVANGLTSNFISENLKMRESQAIGTSQFLADELESVRKRLSEKEDELKRYRTRYMGGLPEQLQTNLSILSRLQAQLDQYNENLRDAENRKILLQQQIAEATRTSSTSVAGNIGERKMSKENEQLTLFKNQLALLRSRYTENHPDVIRLKEAIAKLEGAGKGTSSQETESKVQSFDITPVDQTLKRQLEEINLEIARLKQEVAKTQHQIKIYQKRVEDTPKREQELLALNRDYENLKELYHSLLNRKLEAEIAVSMEKKQKGEQFKVLDPAKVPERPIKPDIVKVLGVTLVLGLMLGGGLAYLVEVMDTSFKDPEEVEKELGLPVLLSLPIRYTERELKRIKMKKILAYSSVSIGFIASVFAILVATKGLDKTIKFFADFINRTGG